MTEILELQDEVKSSRASVPNEKQSEGKNSSTTATLNAGLDTSVPTLAPLGASGEKKKYPHGVVLGKDGKPCRTCTSAADWMHMVQSTGKASRAVPNSPSDSGTTTTEVTNTQNEECPPDVMQLGRSTWTFLHTLSANYPQHPTPQEKRNMASFMRLFGRLYPCWVCAEDFREWMSREGYRLDADERPGVEVISRRFERRDLMMSGEGSSTIKSNGGSQGWLDSRDRFGLWMCLAHNAVNLKLGKAEFDCRKWEERWRTGCGVGEFGEG